MAFHRPWMVRSAALRRCALSLEKACSIGSKSGCRAGGTEASRRCFRCGAHGRCLVARQVVHDDDVTAVQIRQKDTGHIGEERIGVHRPSSTQGATMPVRRSPAVKVVVFQCPKGMPARNRCPRRHRPWRRAMLVDAQVSSMKTSCRDRDRAGLRTIPRGASGRRGGPARSRGRSFFARDPVPGKEAP